MTALYTVLKFKLYFLLSCLSTAVCGFARHPATNMAHSVNPGPQIVGDNELAEANATMKLDSSGDGNLKSHKSDEQRSHRPGSIEIVPGLNIIDLTRSPTDSSRQELQGLTIHDLDTDDTDDSEEVPNININQEHPSPTAPMVIPTNRSIRFRSRVRITSGVHRHREHRHRNTAVHNSLHPAGLLGRSEGNTAVSSCSSSPSSSISAPIRFREDEATVSPKWGPLGQRVQLFVSQQKDKAKRVQADREACEREARRRYLLVYSPGPNSVSNFARSPANDHERTPLLNPARTGQQKSPAAAPLGDGDDSDLCEIETESDYEARLNHEIDMIFGQWPKRLLNRHWWWWQIKPIVCCSYAEDWETEF
ncbi:hypothetical protein F5879DRAFT_963157 [Lentinula edodes]|nr:hypothetical protein F5879DRAFT_963157 [Lentinula edodes]